MIVNVTPHPLSMYAPEDIEPGGIVRDGAEPIAVYPTSGKVARLVVTDHGVAGEVDGFPVRRANFGALEGLPPRQPGVKYVVALPCVAVCLAAGRDDILVLDGQVRARTADGRPGAVIGATGFGEPVA